MGEELKGFILFGFENIFKTAVAITSSYLIITNLNPQDYGNYSLGISIYTILLAIGSVGLDPILFKKLVKKNNSKILEESFLLRIIVSFFLVLISFFLAVVSQNIISILLLILATTLIPLSFNGLKELEFSKKNYRNIVLANFYGYFLQLISLLIIINQELSVLWYAIPIVINKTIYILALIYFNLDFFYKRTIKSIKKIPNLKLLKSGIPILASSILGLLYAVQDQWLIKFYCTTVEVGIFSAGIRFVLYLIVIPTVISNLLYHRIGNNINSGEVDKNVLKGIYSVMFYIMISIFIFMRFIINNSFFRIFPTEYFESIEIFNLYSFIIISSSFQSLNNKLLVLDDLEKVIFYRSILALLVNILLNLILIPKIGIEGAAIATIVSEYLVLISYSVKSHTRYILKLQMQAINFRHIRYLLK